MPNTKHGMSNTTEYKTWKRIKNRCYNKNDVRYHDWGGRGITVCDEWINDFPKFFIDMGLKLSPTHSIDRIDNDKGYSKDNCRWATCSEQSRNRRNSTSKTGCPGVFFLPSGKLRARISIKNKPKSLGCFDTLLNAACARKSAEVNYV